MSSDESVYLLASVDPWPTKPEMARILEDAGLDVVEGQLSVRIHDCEHFVFQEYGGDLGEPQVEADASSRARMIADATYVSDVLSAASIRHRFELYAHCESTTPGKPFAVFEHDWSTDV